MQIRSAPNSTIARGPSNGRAFDATRDFGAAATLSVVLVALAVETQAVDRVLGIIMANVGSRLAEATVTFALVMPVVMSLYAVHRHRVAARTRDRLAQLSVQDPLTGLPNRRYLTAWLAHVLSSHRNPYFQVAVLFIDLDRFKGINDTYGHEVGDELMVAVSARLRTCVREEDRVVRYGGDEFVVVCTDVSSAQVAERIADRIITAVAMPVTIGGDQISVSASIGISLASGRDDTADELLREADDAMYRAKARGGCHATFDRETKPVSRRHAVDRLQNALLRDQFVLHYQPVVRVDDRSIVGVEALVRWQDPERGLVPPNEFIPLLEESGLIVPVGAWVLEEACTQARRWRQLFPDRAPVRVTANVAARQLAQADFADVVSGIFRTTGVDPNQLCLEITEGALMADVSGAWAVLRKAKAAGVCLALDDFGTGYSSLSYIRRFNLDMLKVDRSFVSGLGESPEDAAIVEHVIAMAQALGMEVVGEGVENETQLDHLRRFGCDLAQGYLFSKPVEAEEIDRLLRQEAVEQLEAMHRLVEHRDNGALVVLADPLLEGLPVRERLARP